MKGVAAVGSHFRMNTASPQSAMRAAQAVADPRSATAKTVVFTD
jgi:hypothetical protein